MAVPVCLKELMMLSGLYLVDSDLFLHQSYHFVPRCPVEIQVFQGYG